MTPRQLGVDLLDGLRYLRLHRAILYPLMLTFATIALAGPLVVMLPVVVLSRGGSPVDLGALGAALGLGSVAGAAFAAARPEGRTPTGLYAVMGLFAALAVGLFVLVPTAPVALGALAVIGFITFVQAVWNTSRIRGLADPSYQARLQAITSMAFTLGLALAGLWAGSALDRLGLDALLLGAAGLALCSVLAASVRPDLAVAESSQAGCVR